MLLIVRNFLLFQPVYHPAQANAVVQTVIFWKAKNWNFILRKSSPRNKLFLYY